MGLFIIVLIAGLLLHKPVAWLIKVLDEYSITETLRKEDRRIHARITAELQLKKYKTWFWILAGAVLIVVLMHEYLPKKTRIQVIQQDSISVPIKEIPQGDKLPWE